MQRAQGFSRRHAGGEAQLLDIDHLPFHGDRHRDPEHRNEEHPGQHQRHRHRLVVDDDVGREGRDQRAAGGVAGRAGRGLHAVVLQDRHRRAGQTDAVQRGPDGVGEDAGGDGHAEAPAGLEPDVEVGKRQHASQTRPNQHGAPGKLRHAVSVAAIDLFVPLSLDLFGRALEAGDREPRVSLISSVNRESHRWRGSCCRDWGHGWQPSTVFQLFGLRGARPDCWCGGATSRSLAIAFPWRARLRLVLSSAAAFPPRCGQRHL